MKKLLHLVGRLLILAVFLGAAYLLYHNLNLAVEKQLDRPPENFGEVVRIIWKAVLETPPRGVAFGFVLMVINYMILVGYDVLAIRWVGAQLPLWKIAWASFTSYVFSYNFGATLFGTSIRWRFYSVWGVSLMKILELLLILGLTFWFGLFALAGVVFVADPLEVPQTLMDKYHPPFSDTYWFGWLLLSFAVVYVGLAAFYRGTLRIWRWTIPVPPLKLTIYQIAIASADLMVAAAVLHAVLPSMEGVSYFTTLGAFMLAFTISVLTHVPGGYGVFELTLIAFMPSGDPVEIFAGILVFRLLYYWLPLLAGGVLLALHEFSIRGEKVAPGARGTQARGTLVKDRRQKAEGRRQNTVPRIVRAPYSRTPYFRPHVTVPPNPEPRTPNPEL